MSKWATKANGYSGIIKRIQNFCTCKVVSEALGATVKWNANIRTVYIDMNGDVAPSPEPTGEQ